MNDVRQNPETSAVAVKAAPNRWGVMHPEHGGHWATDDEVQNWADLEEVN